MSPPLHLARSLAALLLLLLALCADFVLGALYHYAHPPWVVAGVIGAYAAVPCALAYGAWRWIARAGTLWLLDLLALQLFAYLVFNTLRRLHLFEGALPLPLKLALAAASLGGGAWLLAAADAALRGRLANAMIACAALFLLAPPLGAAFTAPALAFPIAPLGPGPARDGAPNVVVLLLDELGDQAAQPVIDALLRARLGVARAALTPLGENTVNVIPALLTGRDFTDARPCSLSAICGGDTILDFARMRSAEARLDIVGFHHPYCRIGGLRYCHQARTPSMENPFAWFGCVLLKAVYKPGIDACARRLLSIAQMEATRRDLLAALARAPFWTGGGVLFVHHPLPHPPGRREQRSLDADYAANLDDSAALVGAIAARLRASFGERFALIISSDHPLRPQVWCPMARYAQTACVLRAAFTSTRVPLLLATPGPAPDLAGETDLFRLVDRVRRTPAGTPE